MKFCLSVNSASVVLATVGISIFFHLVPDASGTCYRAKGTGATCGVSSEAEDILRCNPCTESQCPTYGCTEPAYRIQAGIIKECEIAPSGLWGHDDCVQDADLYAIKFVYRCNATTHCVELDYTENYGEPCDSDFEAGSPCQGT